MVYLLGTHVQIATPKLVAVSLPLPNNKDSAL